MRGETGRERSIGAEPVEHEALKATCDSECVDVTPE